MYLVDREIDGNHFGLIGTGLGRIPVKFGGNFSFSSNEVKGSYERKAFAIPARQDEAFK